MKIAISNIAWPIERDAAVADTLVDLGVSGIEVAPTKLWPAPLEASTEQIDSYRRFWNSRGISIVAAQALLFGKPDLTLFENPEIRKRTLDYLSSIIRVCARLGANSLVFGSPKNRRVGDRERNIVWGEAVDFFQQLAGVASEAGTAIVMEANPPEYGADFITKATEALELVRAVNHSGFRLHLDTACMMMAGDDANDVIHSAGPLVAHFHASEPQLAPVGGGPVDHARFAAALAAARYNGWVSIEMRQVEPFDIQSIRHAVLRVQVAYGTV